MTDELARIRGTYDTIASRYEAEVAGELAYKPLDRAMLDAFAALIAAGPAGTVGDVGCGPGHITAYLAGRGLDVRGVDLSPAMVATAKARHGELEFVEGSMTALDVADGAWAGATVMYAIIHLPAALRTAAYGELARVIRAGGWLLVSFHVATAEHASGATHHLDTWWDHAVDIDAHFLDPEEVARGLVAAGFVIDARLDREPIAGHEYPSRRTYLLARRV